MPSGDIAKAEELFSRSVLSSLNRFGMIFTFRNVAELGLPSATLAISRESVRHALELYNDPEHEKLFIDKERAFELFGGVDGLAGRIAGGSWKISRLLSMPHH